MLIAQRRPSFLNVYSYFEKEGKYSGRSRPIGKTADATGYCERTVSRIVREKRAKDGVVFVSPAKRYKKERKNIIVDDFDM